MISFSTIKRYCKDNLYLIENYDKAINDETQIWVCHHRLEIDLNLTPKQLIEIGRYYKVPASELIFMTRSDHTSLHNKNRPPISEETKRKKSESMKGKNKGKSTWNKGIHTGIVSNGFNGHKHSEETKRKKSESMKKYWALKKGAM